MSKVSITRSLLDDLAVSISVKSGEPVPMTLAEMKDAVDSISGGDVTVESLSVTSNGTYRAPTGKAYSPVSVNVPAPSPSLQTKTKTYTPTTSQQTESVTADSGYDGLGQVNITVNAVDLELKTYNVSSTGYHAVTPSDGYIGLSEVDVIVPSMGDPQISTTPQGQSGGSISQTDTLRYFNLPSGFNPTAKYYSIPNLAYLEYPTELIDDEWPSRYVATIIPSTSTKYLSLQNGYYQTSGQYTIPALEDRSATFTPSESTQTQTISKSNQGFSGLNEVTVTVNPIPSNYVGSGVTRRTSADLTASGGTVAVPSGYYSAQASKAVASGSAGIPIATKGTVSNHSVSVTPSVTNTTGYITGGTSNGTAVSVSASELVSGTLNVTSAGTKDVTNYASASIPSGTEGTPTATKGTVSNHSVSVTPSVTNTAGYITGSTKTGTAVTVSASELVSGSETKTENGTYNVTNLASLVVDIPFSTIYTGSTNPSSSTGSNGDIYLKVVS